jgi:hypothetical protein
VTGRGIGLVREGRHRCRCAVVPSHLPEARAGARKQWGLADTARSTARRVGPQAGRPPAGAHTGDSDAHTTSGTRSRTTGRPARPSSRIVCQSFACLLISAVPRRGRERTTTAPGRARGGDNRLEGFRQGQPRGGPVSPARRFRSLAPWRFACSPRGASGARAALLPGASPCINPTQETTWARSARGRCEHHGRHDVCVVLTSRCQTIWASGRSPPLVRWTAGLERAPPHNEGRSEQCN